MKKVVSSAMVAHLWAHKTQSEARNAQHSMYFEGDTIYSYGSHFPIARHFKGIVLFNANTYSSTTGQHKATTQSAIRNMTVIYVIELDTLPPNIEMNFKHFTHKIKEFMQKSIRARTEWRVNSWLRQANDMCKNANAYSKLVKRKRRFALPDPEAVKLAVSKAKERDKIAAAKLAIKNAEKMVEWENGALICLDYRLPCCLRLKLPASKLPFAANQIIQTSQGAEFPVSHGKRVYAFAKKCRETKTAFQHNGHSIPIGVFKIDSISKTGDIKAGCHNVKWDAIERFAKRMEW